METRLMETPEKWPSMILQTDWSFGPQCIYVCLCMIKITGMWKPSYSIKPAASPVPTVPELYKIHPIMWTLVYKVRLCPTSSGFKDWAFIVAHHASLQVSTLYGNREIWKCSLFVLNSPKTHITMPTGSIPEALNYRYLYMPGTQWWSQRCPL